MIRGESITLRPMREADLDQMVGFHADIANRGRYFPLGVLAEPVYRQRFRETGFWEKDEGMLLIVSPQDDILGHVEVFPTVDYLDEVELSYQLYDPTTGGRGVMTEAVDLMAGFCSTTAS